MSVWRSAFPRKYGSIRGLLCRPLRPEQRGSHRRRAEKAQLETDGGIGPNRNNHKEGGAAKQGYENNNLPEYWEVTR